MKYFNPKKASIFVLLFCCLFIFNFKNTYAYGNGFANSRQITIDHTKVQNTDQTDFPVLFSGTYSYLANVNNGGAVRNTSGYDIGFYTNSDCSTGKLNWEKERYVSTTGDVSYWIKLPTVSYTDDTSFYICYGNQSISTDQSNKNAVWSSNYASVWHLADGTNLSATDSTLNGVNGNITDATASSGKIDGSGNFDGVSGKIAFPGFSIPSTGTISAWYKPTNAVGTSFEPIVSTRTLDGGVQAFDFYPSMGTGFSGWYKNGVDERIEFNPAAYMSAGNWYYITMTWQDGGDTVLRINSNVVNTKHSLSTTWNTSLYTTY
ncbi:MAG: hypothetical protein ACR2IQ_00205, partial [Minisyncoccia bacterium]